MYVTSKSQLSELFAAPRTPCNLLASATCVLRSLAATHRVFFDEMAPPDRTMFIRVLPEDNHALALFMLYQDTSTVPPPPAGNLFPQPLPVLFLEGMAFLHTAITPDLDTPDLVCFTYPSDITMQVDDDRLAQLFTTLIRLHCAADTLTCAILESVNTYISPWGFLWLLRAWQTAWDIGVRSEMVVVVGICGVVHGHSATIVVVGVRSVICELSAS